MRLQLVFGLTILVDWVVVFLMNSAYSDLESVVLLVCFVGM